MGLKLSPSPYTTFRWLEMVKKRLLGRVVGQDVALAQYRY